MDAPFSHAGEVAALATACCWTVPLVLAALIVLVSGTRTVDRGHCGAAN